MIQLKYQPRPPELTDEIIHELTEVFKANQELAVWKRRAIKDAIKTGLLKMSNFKCCYCECKLQVETAFMEVEHFYHKKKYPEDVLTWENLLPACGRCNKCKGAHDTKLIPILHPVRNIPNKHLLFHLFEIKGSTDLGQKTVEKLDLNNNDFLLMKRRKIIHQLNEELSDLWDLTEDYFAGKSDRKEMIQRKMFNLMKIARPNSEHTAVMSTALTNNSHYLKTKDIFQQNDFWNATFQKLEMEIMPCVLPLKNEQSLYKNE